MGNNEYEIERFLRIKEANGQSKWTIEGQGRILRKLNKFLKGKSFRETSEDDIISFVSKMNRISAPSTMKLIKIVIKSFYRHLYGMNKYERPQQVKNLNCNNYHPRIPMRPEDVITKEDIAEIVQHCDNLRDKAIIVALYESACRIGEFCSININNMKFDDKGVVLLVSGKTGERRIRMVESVPFIQQLIESHPRKHENGAPLWCSSRKPYKRLSPTVMREVLNKVKRHSSFKKPMNPHAFRHSRLTELAKYLSDAKLKLFAGWSQHSRMASTYVHLCGKDLDDDLLFAAGVDPEKTKPKESPLKVKTCPRCSSKNSGIDEFCHLCGKPFNEAMVVKETLETQILTTQVAELKERSEVADDVIDSMWNVIDQLKRQIHELKRE